MNNTIKYTIAKNPLKIMNGFIEWVCCGVLVFLVSIKPLPGTRDCFRLVVFIIFYKIVVGDRRHHDLISYH